MEHPAGDAVGAVELRHGVSRRLDLGGASYGNETLVAGSGDVDVWDLTVDVGKTTTDGSGVSDASAASVAESTKFPTETLYCVTVTLDRK